MFEQREEAAQLTKELAKRSTYLAERVNLTGSSLSPRSPYLVTIATLYEAVKIVTPVLPESDFEARVASLVEMWDAALGALPGVQAVHDGESTAGELRTTYIYASGLGFEALAEALASAIRTYPARWQDVLKEGLPRIAWQLKEQQWEGVALFAGRIAIARAARRRTSVLVRHLLGLPVEDRELDELQEVYKTTNFKLPSPVLQPEKVAAEGI